jgi:molybdopterin converting factor subunit 1
MKVTVLYFAALRDLAGRAEEELTLPDAAMTVKELGVELGRRVPGLTERMSHVRVARNEAFAGDAELVHDGDVIALIPPVAGG